MTRRVEEKTIVRFCKGKLFVGLFCLAALCGCDNATPLVPDYDFTKLGNTPIDGTLKNDVVNYQDFYTYYRDADLPEDNPLVRDVKRLFDKNLKTANDIEQLGAVCAKEGQQRVCTYRGLIITRYHTFINPVPDFITEYDISIYPDAQPMTLKIFRKKYPM